MQFCADIRALQKMITLTLAISSEDEMPLPTFWTVDKYLEENLKIS